MSTEQTIGPWFIWQELAMQKEGLEPEEIESELLDQESFDIYAGTPKEITRGLLVGCKKVAEIDAFDFDDDSKAALEIARLIAAAHDMLDALQKAAVLLAAVNVHSPELEPYETYMAVSAAIAKATRGAA